MALKITLSALLWATFISHSDSALEQNPTSPVERVPVAPPRIAILIAGEEPEPWSEPTLPAGDEIFLQVPSETDYFRGEIPRDVWEAVDVLRIALPIDYKEMLMNEFGYERIAGGSITSTRTDLRVYDLASFLFERWVHLHSDTQLAKEFECLSWGEGDIEPFLRILVDVEAQDFVREADRAWRLQPQIANSRMPDSSPHNLLLGRCQELIELRVSIDEI